MGRVAIEPTTLGLRVRPTNCNELRAAESPCNDGPPGTPRTETNCNQRSPPRTRIRTHTLRLHRLLDLARTIGPDPEKFPFSDPRHPRPAAP